MSTGKKRPYNSKGRLLKAQETKKRILDAAKALFSAEGFEPVTIEKIAKTATVSVPTIYLLFRSKRGILRALMDEALSNDQYQALVEGATKDESPYRRLEITATLVRQMYDKEHTLLALFRGAAILSPEFQELEHELEERRYSRQKESVTELATRGWLIKELNLSKARDIIWAFTGRDLYRLFVVERGWSSDAYEAWLAKTLKTLLLSPDLDLFA